MAGTVQNENITITDAHWEERNIGCKAIEIEFSAAANALDVNTILEFREGLVTVKLPTSRIDLVHNLEEAGFNYIENQFIIEKRLSFLNDINPLFTNIADDFYPKEIETKDDKNLLLDEVSKGMFDTDRFFVDPLFGESVSSSRFKNWLNDLFENEKVSTTLIKSKKTDESVSFITVDYSKKYPHGILGGAFSAHKKTGISHIAIYFALLKARQKGYKRFRTAISSNNTGVLNIYSSIFSFNIIDARIVLRKVFC